MKKHVFAVALISVVLFATQTLFPAQAPPSPPAPVQSYHFDCVSRTSATLKVVMDLDRDPLEALRAMITNVKPTSTDTTIPVITSVVNSSAVSLLTNAVKISPTGFGLPVTIGAGDDVGIVSAALYVDNVRKTTTGDGVEALPVTFYMRWNARDVPVGNHFFKVVVWDAGGNSAEKTWTMIR